MLLFNINAPDLIQCLIGLILLLTAFLEYISYRGNKYQQKLKLIDNLIKEERDLIYKINSYKTYKIKSKIERDFIENQTDSLIFDFYEYLAILLFRKDITMDICYNYFKNKFYEVYFNFMDSKLFFDGHKQRYTQYPTLTLLFNSLDLSIKENEIEKIAKSD